MEKLVHLNLETARTIHSCQIWSEFLQGDAVVVIDGHRVITISCVVSISNNR